MAASPAAGAVPWESSLHCTLGALQPQTAQGWGHLRLSCAMPADSPFLGLCHPSRVSFSPVTAGGAQPCCLTAAPCPVTYTYYGMPEAWDNQAPPHGRDPLLRAGNGICQLSQEKPGLEGAAKGADESRVYCCTCSSIAASTLSALHRNSKTPTD